MLLRLNISEMFPVGRFARCVVKSCQRTVSLTATATATVATSQLSTSASGSKFHVQAQSHLARKAEVRYSIRFQHALPMGGGLLNVLGGPSQACQGNRPAYEVSTICVTFCYLYFEEGRGASDSALGSTVETF